MIIIDEDEFNYTYKVKEEEPFDGVRIYFENDEGDSNIHYWGGDLGSSNWPGDAMTEEDVNLYVKEFEGANSSSFVINWDGGQTEDINIEEKGTYYITKVDSSVNDEGKTIWKVSISTEYNLNFSSAPVITTDPVAGNNKELSLLVSLITSGNLDNNSKTYYTIDESIPEIGGELYINSIYITNDTIIKAIAVDADNNISKVYSFEFKLGKDLTAPEIKALTKAGTYSELEEVEFEVIDDPKVNTVPNLYYTLNGDKPTEDSNLLYTGPIKVGKGNNKIQLLAIDHVGNKAEKSYTYYVGELAKKNWDFRDETIYFLMTTRFYDGDGQQHRTSGDDAAGNPQEDSSWRGEFEGLIQKLDYLKALGFTAIWITPPVANNSGYDYHGYHASSFHEIDSRLGGIDKYQELINEAHKRDMKIIQDVVFNHSGPTGLSFPNGHFNLGSGAYHNAGQIQSWEGYICQTGDVAGADCADLNTEDEGILNVIIDAYSKYIDMGVDAFRIDTAKHINRMIFNRYFTPAFKKRAKENGNDNFYMFGEVCTRDHNIWNKGVYSLSTPFYTWKERFEVSGSLSDQVKYLYDKENGETQRSSDNMFLDGNDYHKPDYSENSGLNIIDFPMHWYFESAGSAFNFASQTENDSTYNDSTWNVTYVDSHDYGPNSNDRYEGGTKGWADSMSLMWTFRGIPCIYYGSEIEFQAGMPIDKGTSEPLSGTGRAYFGDYLEGNVTASNFSEFEASGKVEETLNKPLAKHLRDLNRIRKAIPALRKGQYSKEGVNGNMAFKRRYTDKETGIDSYALVTIGSSATFTDILAGTYFDVVTGDEVEIEEGESLSANCEGAGNLRVYVLNLPGNPAPGILAKESEFLK